MPLNILLPSLYALIRHFSTELKTQISPLFSKHIISYFERKFCYFLHCCQILCTSIALKKRENNLKIKKKIPHIISDFKIKKNLPLSFEWDLNMCNFLKHSLKTSKNELNNFQQKQ